MADIDQIIQNMIDASLAPVKADVAVNKATIAALDGRVDALENDVDPPEPVISELSVADLNATEKSGSVAFEVTLTPASTAQVRVNYTTVDGTAKAGSDYTAKSSTLIFDPGQTSKTVSVAITDDIAVEDAEAFSLKISNADGATIAKDTGTCTLTSDDVAPPTTGSPPLTFDDPRFNGNSNRTGQTNVANGGTLANVNITGNVQLASVVLQGSGTVRNCSVKSNECVRIVGGTSNVEDCWLEAKGSGDDHADVIQAYSPGSTGTHNLKNTTLRAYNTAATAGLFIADSWKGNVNLENVVFWGGPYGCRIHADAGCTINVSFKDVFFVGPFGYDSHIVEAYGGTLNVTKWENVCNATIVDGKIVPGSPIPRP